VAWLLLERSNGGKLVGEYVTREKAEAEAEKDRLIAEDPRYEDLLVVIDTTGPQSPTVERSSP